MARFGSVAVTALGVGVAMVVFAGCIASGVSLSSDAGGGEGGQDGQRGDASDPGRGGGFAALDGGREVDRLSSDAACAVSEADGKLAPVNLVFMFDKSGSMSDFGKWQSVVKSMKAFFKDAQSNAVRASLTYFPKSPDLYCGSAECCSVDSYATPSVPLTALPDATVFAASLDAAMPGGGTPTVPAIRAAIRQARAIAEAPAHRGETTAIVLVTDGMPNDSCDPERSSVERTVNAVRDANDDPSHIRAYVVGIESPYHAGALDGLHDVARQGGTGAAIMVMPSDAEGTAKAFADALAEIRRRAVACHMPIPTPPDGTSFDRTKVNVTVSRGGQVLDLTYDEACRNDEGWRYDDRASPSFIELCSSSCTAVKSKIGTTLRVQFGCETRISVH